MTPRKMSPTSHRIAAALQEAKEVRVMAASQTEALDARLTLLREVIYLLDAICSELPLVAREADAALEPCDASPFPDEVITDPVELLRGERELTSGLSSTCQRLARALVGKLQGEGMTEDQATAVVLNVFGVDVIDRATTG